MIDNPLRDPQDRRLPRVAGPCGMVLFGVTGDLARKKLMPAIYDLANRGLLPPGFSLVGFARREPEAARALRQATEQITACAAVDARQSPALSRWLARAESEK